MAKAQNIQNPRRILAVSLEASTEQLSSIVKDLTGTPPEPAAASLAGTTHNLELRTAYYNATVPIWLDLVNGPPDDWASSFLSDEAKEVLEVLGGLVVVFAIPPETAPTSTPTQQSPSKDETTALIREVGRVVKEGLGGWEWDGVSLAVGVGEVGHLDDLDTWDEVCGDAGLEFVHVASAAAASSDARNEFGEKVGVLRVLEALESSDWASVPGVSGRSGSDLESPVDGEHLGDDDDEFDFENMDFGFDKEDFEGLKKAIWEAKLERENLSDTVDKHAAQEGEGSGAAAGTSSAVAQKEEEGDDDDIRKVEQMMQKLQAVRDMSAGLPEDQRKRMAARAVGEVMRDL